MISAKGEKALQLNQVVSAVLQLIERQHVTRVLGGSSSKSMTYYLEEKKQTKLSF